MSFNLALQPQSPTSSSLSSIDDQVNNPAARVYFGPIQSPERFLIAEATHKRNNISVRRSSRLSALQNPQQLAFSLEEEGKAASGDQGGLKVAPPLTAPGPDEDSSQDDLEPTSALATKISRAHDNPSPPPTMQPLKQGSGNQTFPVPTGQHPPSDPAVPKASGSAIADGPLHRAQTPTPPMASPELIDHNQATSLPANVSADLIVFDDDNLPDIPKVSPVVHHFPDLLAPTPSRQFFRDLRSAFRTTLSTRVCSPGNKSPEQDHVSPSRATTRSPASNPPSVEPPAQLRQSPHFSQRGSPSSHSNQRHLVLQDDVDPSNSCSSQADKGPSEATGRNVVTEQPRQVRELRSLSPVSEDVLYNLLSTTGAMKPTPLDAVPALASVCPVDELPRDRLSTPEHRSSSEQQNGPVAIRDVQRPPPERSPWRSHITNPVSPSKFGCSSTLDDPNRTPARRIPIGEAIAQGSASPRKDCSSGPFTGIFRRPVFTRYTPEDRIRSPIRQTPSNLTNHTVLDSSRLARPITSASPERVRCGSEEPDFSRKHHLGRPFQRSASDSIISSPSKARRNPTFPDHPDVHARLPSTIPEERGVGLPTKSTQSSPSLKSALRQPSTMAGSRIPRIGAKPYARPTRKEEQLGKGKMPVHKPFVTRRPTSSSAPTKPVRLVKSVGATGSGSSSEDHADFHAVIPGDPSISQTSTSILPQSSPSLKRKRPAEEILSPRATQPTFARLVSVSKPKPSSALPAPPDSGPVLQKRRIGHVRRVGGDIAAQKHAARGPGTQASVDETANTREHPTAHPASTPSESQIAQAASPSAVPPAIHTAPEQPTLSSIQTESASPPDILTTTLQAELDASSPDSPSDGLSLTTTRVTRSRRNQKSANDVFGHVRPSQSRRRHPTETPGESTFSSMSALALKSLTTSNTAKNQHNLVAVLETEVVRKPGKRPGSPTTRVKTVEDKRKLEQGQGRRERAERRARRASDPLEDLSLTSEDEESLPLGPDGQPLRHRRGPGDDDDYESPGRVGRPEKRARTREEGEPGEGVGAKTVRWDRGLFTTIYFDDLPLQLRARDKPREHVTFARGALARSAKALHLDSLGNLVNATSPLNDLVQENVVVKKYVYDDDAEAAEIDVPKPPSKGKGKKSKG